jgi:hypothetical protein
LYAADLRPGVVEALQHVAVAVLPRCAVAQRRESEDVFIYIAPLERPVIASPVICVLFCPDTVIGVRCAGHVAPCSFSVRSARHDGTLLVLQEGTYDMTS